MRRAASCDLQQAHRMPHAAHRLWNASSVTHLLQVYTTVDTPSQKTSDIFFSFRLLATFQVGFKLRM